MNAHVISHRLSGWTLFWLVSGLVLLMSAAALAIAPDWVEGLRSAIRATARSSFLLFIAAFAASAMASLVPSSLTKSLVRERRFLGLAFAFSHLVHAILICLYAKDAPDLFWNGRTAAGTAPGTVGYVFVLLLTLTSFKSTTRLIGARVWKVLHKIGVWVIAAVFAYSFFKRIPMSQYYALPFALLMSVVVLRGVAFYARRIKRSVRLEQPVLAGASASAE